MENDLFNTQQELKKKDWENLKKSSPLDFDVIRRELGFKTNRPNKPNSVVRWLDRVGDCDKEFIAFILEKNPSLPVLGDFLDWYDKEASISFEELLDFDSNLSALVQKDFSHYSPFIYVFAWLLNKCEDTDGDWVMNFEFEDLTGGLSVFEFSILSRAVYYDFCEMMEYNFYEYNPLVLVDNFLFEWVKEAKEKLELE